MTTATTRLGALLRRPNAPEQVLHVHRDLPLLATVGVSRGTARKLATAIVRVWGSLPDADRLAMSRMWATADTIFALAEFSRTEMLGKCDPSTATIMFSADHVERLPDWLVQVLTAHELSHAACFARQGDVGDETQADALTTSWGYSMSLARAYVNAGAWR
jgi:hypothetical protein